MTSGDTMESKRGDSAKLPLEIIERALSFLAVPELCRMRSVCKAWKEIVNRPSFHDLCDVNGRDAEYLFMWSEFFRRRRVVVNPIFSDTLYFLDVDAKRWYSIPAVDLPRVCGCGREVESRFMAMNDGLVCELTTAKDCADDKFALTISDPVAKTRRTLPTPPQVFVAEDIPLVHSVDSHLVSAQILTAVDCATRSYKVFLLNNLSVTHAQRAQPRVYVHESFTNEWRALSNLPNGVQEEWEEDDWAESAVISHQSIFALKQHTVRHFSYKLTLFRYSFQDDTWAEAYQMYFPREFDSNPILVASSDRLFLSVWLSGARSSDPALNPHASDPGLKSDPDCLDPGFFEYPNYPETDSYFEMYEILIAEYRRKLVIQLTRAQLQQIFGSDGSEIDNFCAVNVTHAFPCFDSNAICNSVVLVKATGKGYDLRRYELATGSVDVLPPHPLAKSSEESIGVYFTAEIMKLSLRNLLAPCQKKLASTGWRLLQGGCHHPGDKFKGATHDILRKTTSLNGD